MPKNENPLHSITQLDKEINYKDFVYKNYFKHICNLKPHSKNGAEHLEVIPIEKNLVNESGFVYIFVIENKIQHRSCFVFFIINIIKFLYKMIFLF